MINFICNNRAELKIRLQNKLLVCILGLTLLTHLFLICTGAAPFPRPSPYPGLSGLSSGAFGGLGEGLISLTPFYYILGQINTSDNSVLTFAVFR